MIVTSIDQITQEEQLSWLGHDYAIDIETEGLDYINHELIGVALYVNGKSYYFVRKHTADDGKTIVNYLPDHHLRHLLNPIMSQRDRVSCLHNSKFDLHGFERNGLPLLSQNFDTLMAAQLLDENRQNGLKDLNGLVGEEHTKYEALAEWSNFPKGSPYNVRLESFAAYAEKDVIVTYKLWQLFREQLPKESFKGVSLQDVFNTVWMPLVPVLQEMESFGFKINTELAKELKEKYTEIASKASKAVEIAGYEMLSRRDPKDIANYYWVKVEEDDEIYEDENGRLVLDIMDIQTPVWRPSARSMLRKVKFNIGSPKQLVDLIMQDVELPRHAPKLVLTKGGEDSVNVENIVMIQHFLGDRAPSYLEDLKTWRKATKFLNPYLELFTEGVDENDRLHGFFSMAQNDAGRGGTRTGRLSSSNPNMQNISSRGEIGAEARDCFIAEEGNNLIVADYESMEMVIMAHYSQDPILMKAFEENLDVHALTACAQHNIPYDEFIEHYKNGNLHYDNLRRAAKVLNFGQAYGMGVVKLQRTLLVQNGQEYTLEETKELLRSFNSAYTVLNEWKQKVRAFARKNGWVPTILGRKRRLPNIFSPDPQLSSYAERQAVNSVIQGSCADILFQAMVPIQASFKALGGSLVASVHDEVVGEVPEQFSDAACHAMEHFMVDLINPKLRCKLKAEAHAGKTWHAAKKG